MGGRGEQRDRSFGDAKELVDLAVCGKKAGAEPEAGEGVAAQPVEGHVHRLRQAGALMAVDACSAYRRESVSKVPPDVSSLRLMASAIEAVPCGLGCDPQAGDPRHVLSAGTNSPFLSTTEDERLQSDVAGYRHGTDTFGAVELVGRDGYEPAHRRDG